jgi:flagellar hook-associated protein 1 FlgK
MGYTNARASTLERLESIFAPAEGSRIDHGMSRFFAGAADVSTDPSSLVARQTFLASAKSLANAFNSTAADLRAEGAAIDANLTDGTRRATNLARELAGLNRQIGATVANGEEPSALLDRRDAVATSLAGIVGGDVLRDQDGNVNVSALGSMIVAGNEAQTLSAERNATTGKLDLFATTSDGLRSNVTARATGGEMGALISVRDGELAAHLQTVDALAFDFQTAVNSVHQAATGLDGVSGRALFTGSATSTGAASGITLNAAVTTRGVGASMSATTLPGDNRAMLSMIALADQPLASGGTATFATADRSASVTLANATQGAIVDKEDASSQHEVVNGLLERATSVSTDDEMIQLMQLEKAYQASAKVITVVDGLLDTLVRM